jgi:hypothetical protein
LRAGETEALAGASEGEGESVAQAKMREVRGHQ